MQQIPCLSFFWPGLLAVRGAQLRLHPLLQQPPETQRFAMVFGMDSNRQPLLISDLLLLGDESFGCVSNIQHLGNVEMSLQPTVFYVFPITVRFPGSPRGRVRCALVRPRAGHWKCKEFQWFSRGPADSCGRQGSMHLTVRFLTMLRMRKLHCSQRFLQVSWKP